MDGTSTTGTATNVYWPYWPYAPTVPYWPPTYPFPGYCDCQRCPCCGKVVAPAGPQVTWTTTSGDCGSVTQKG